MAYSPVQLLSTPLEDYAGYWLKFYEESTTTLLSMATDATGGTTLAKAEISSGGTVPIGFLKTAGSALLNPFVDGDYDAWLFPTAAEADANDTTNAIQIADNLNADPNNALVGQFEAWQSTTTYAINEIVLATNGSYYISLVNSNLNFEPSISPTQWQLIPVKDMASTESDTFTTPTLISPIITSAKIDEIVDSSGNELIDFAEVASAVNNVRITNAITTAAAKIDCAETNSDLDLARNGTGDITVDSVPIYGLVILDTPELIASSTAITLGAWNTVNSITLNTALAKKAIVRAKSRITLTSNGALSSTVRLRKTGSAVTNGTEIASTVANQDSTATSYAKTADLAGEGVVNLDANYDFDYSLTGDASASITGSDIYLVGYYA
jgi:hypothetical protein